MSRRLEAYEAQHIRQSRTAALGEMAARVAHEIRNPLTGMKMHLQLLAEKTAAADRAAVERLLDELRRLELVVETTLAVGRDQTLQLTNTDVVAVVAEVVQLMQAAFAHRHVLIATDLAPCAALPVDRDRIKQVLLNLLTNAADALPGGGRVRVTSRSDTTANRLCIAVEDSGGGIEPSIRDRLFDMSSTTKPMGLGLGLALSRDLIRAHGGDLRAESSAELGGARFVIELPLGVAASAAS
jgi:signal transduction histidine kinase